jgi:hypothetical protein
LPRPAAQRFLIHWQPRGVAARAAKAPGMDPESDTCLLLFCCAGSCGHDFCMHCISAWKDERQRFGRSIQCPVCRAELLAIPSQSFGECMRARVRASRAVTPMQRAVPVQPVSHVCPSNQHPLQLSTR